MKNPSKIARTLRKNETEAEQIVWSWLRNRQVNGLKFRRQQPIGDYVVDFVCLDKLLIVEIDGGNHNTDKSIEKDEIRTKWLEARGYKVVRFWNSDVLDNPDGVFDTLTLTLSLQGRGD